MKSFYSKDFGTQDVSYVGKFSTFDDADEASGDDSDWIYAQEDLEDAVHSMLKANVERFPVWVLSSSMDYELSTMRVFLSEPEAEEAYIRMVNHEFDKEYTLVTECDEFLCSDEWWDNDERLKITLEEVGLEAQS